MSLSGEQVMITGATGFLGNVLARRLIEDRANVRILARNPERAKRLQELGAEVFVGEITDLDVARRAIEGCAYVFHSAAALGGKLQLQTQVNVEGTRTIMQASAEAKVRRIVHVSTVSAYGTSYTADVTEDMPLLPGADPYANTKKAAEAVVREMAAQHGIPYSMIRPAMIYGPRSGLWTGQLFRLARRNPTPFIGNGSGNAPAIFVDDVVEMMITLATHPAAENETFNCSADPAPTWREYMQWYSRLAGHENWRALPVPLARVVLRSIALFAPRNSGLRDLPGLLNLVVGHITFKTTKARDRLGWSPKVSLEEGITRCAPWLLEKGWLK